MQGSVDSPSLGTGEAVWIEAARDRNSPSDCASLIHQDGYQNSPFQLGLLLLFTQRVCQARSLNGICRDNPCYIICLVCQTANNIPPDYHYGQIKPGISQIWPSFCPPNESRPPVELEPTASHAAAVRPVNLGQPLGQCPRWVDQPACHIPSRHHPPPHNLHTPRWPLTINVHLPCTLEFRNNSSAHGWFPIWDCSFKPADVKSREEEGGSLAVVGSWAQLIRDYRGGRLSHSVKHDRWPPHLSSREASPKTPSPLNYIN